MSATRTEDRQRTIQYLTRALTGIWQIDPTEYGTEHRAVVADLKKRMQQLLDDAYMMASGSSASDGLGGGFGEFDGSEGAEVAADVPEDLAGGLDQALADAGAVVGHLGEGDGHNVAAERDDTGSGGDVAHRLVVLDRLSGVGEEVPQVAAALLGHLVDVGQEILDLGQARLNAIQLRLGQVGAEVASLVHVVADELQDADGVLRDHRIVDAVAGLAPTGSPTIDRLVALSDRLQPRRVGGLALSHVCLDLAQQIERPVVNMPELDRLATPSPGGLGGLLGRIVPALQKVGQFASRVRHHSDSSLLGQSAAGTAPVDGGRPVPTGRPDAPSLEVAADTPAGVSSPRRSVGRNTEAS